MPHSDANPMDAALRRALAGGSATGCDAELAAAYAEGRLRGAERERFEGHIAACTACRALATAMLDELTPAGPVDEPSPWWSWRSWRWVVPATAGVLVVGSAVYWQRIRVTAPVAEMQRAVQVQPQSSEPPAIPAQTRALKDADHAVANKPVGGPEPARLGRSEAPPVSQPLPGYYAADEVRKAQEHVAATLESNEKKKVAGAPAEEAERQQKGNIVRMKTPANVGLGGEGQLKQQAQVAAPAAAAAPQAPALELGKREADKEAATSNLVAAESRDDRSNRRTMRVSLPMAWRLPGDAPQRSVIGRGDRLWAVSDRGQIFRSSDAGRTWEKLPSPTTEDLVFIEWESDQAIVVRDKKGNVYRVKP